MKIIATNRKAQRDYEILDRAEAGIELKGSEVKSLRQTKVALSDSFARVENGEVFLYNMYIAPYAQASFLNVESKRPRKLLLHKREILRINDRVKQRGYTLIPLKLYFNERGLTKVELGICRGRKLYDHRQVLKQKQAELEIKRALKKNRSG